VDVHDLVVLLGRGALRRGGLPLVIVGAAAFRPASGAGRDDRRLLVLQLFLVVEELLVLLLLRLCQLFQLIE